ncbi:phytanoyl-CoA dioxygenase family protein [Leptolyngbyaceae cyanobacterium UHCC 1019]
MFEESDIRQFQEDGFLIVHNFFSIHQTDLLHQYWKEVSSTIKFGDGSLQRLDRFLFGVLSGNLGRLYSNERLVSAAQSLLADNDIALYGNRMLLKDERWNGGVETHQDITSFHGGLRKLSAFVPLQSHTLETGGLKIIKGSHWYGNLGIQGTIFPEEFPEMEVVVPSLEVGDVLFMDFLTWHYSEAALVESDRPLMQIIYQSANDGSYYQLAEPTLVAGNWRTNYFIPHGYGIARNNLSPGESILKEKEAEIVQLQAHLEKVKLDYQEGLQTIQQDQAKIFQIQESLEACQNKVDAMESSKFWKLREAWIRLKELVK